MLASELIKALQTAVEENGDLPVLTYSECQEPVFLQVSEVVVVGFGDAEGRPVGTYHWWPKGDAPEGVTVAFWL